MDKSFKNTKRRKLCAFFFLTRIKCWDSISTQIQSRYLDPADEFAQKWGWVKIVRKNTMTSATQNVRCGGTGINLP